MLIATAAVTFLASCGTEDTDDPKPDPAVNLKTTAGYTSSNVTVTPDSTLKAGVIPTVKIAFGTATALEAVGNMGNCTQNIAAQVGFIAGEPDVSVTFE